MALGLASVRDLDEYLSIEDCYDLIEVAKVKAHNRRVFDANNKPR